MVARGTSLHCPYMTHIWLIYGSYTNPSPQAEQALEGLRVILGVKPGTLNAMVPKLMRPPLSAAHVRALGELGEAAGTFAYSPGAVFGHRPHKLPTVVSLYDCTSASQYDCTRAFVFVST